MYDFKFSVVMPIYNVEKYLCEAIDSLINQSIGFEENVELIVVDDESPDRSKDIALKYQEKYPNNIKVLSKPNGGQASAFNLGLKYVHGKYISFLDSDDCLSSETFEEVYNFFEEHYDEIDLVSIPMMLFERTTGEHVLNYKFKSTRVIDLMKEPSSIQLSVASSFLKSESIRDLEFNTELLLGYDTLMINKLFLDKKKYGVVNSSHYHYRKRLESDSTIDNSKSQKEYYTHTLKNLDMELIEYYMENLGYVPKFIQYVVAYNVEWFYKISDFPDFFTKAEIDEFWETFYEILSYVDEDVLNDSTIIKKTFVKHFLMYLKNRGEFHIDIVDVGSEIPVSDVDSVSEGSSVDVGSEVSVSDVDSVSEGSSVVEVENDEATEAIGSESGDSLVAEAIGSESGDSLVAEAIESELEDSLDVVSEPEIYLKTGDYIINNLHLHRIYLDNVELDDGSLKLLGTFTSECDYDALRIEAIRVLPDGTEEVYEEIVNDFTEEKSNVKRFLGIDWQFKHYFSFEIPIDENEDSTIVFHVIYEENDEKIVMSNDIKFRDSALLADMINYFVKGSQIVFFRENTLNICPYSDEKAYELKQELLSYIKELLENEKQLKKDKKSLNKKNKNLDKKNKSLNKKNKDLNKKNKDLNKKNKNLEKKKENLENKNKKLNDKNKKLNEKNKNLAKKNKNLKESLNKSRAKNKEILNSTSWKITKPLRMPKQLIQKRKD